MTPQGSFDVVIMGGGWAGNCQARHLLLNVPGIRVAIVEPRTDAEVLEDRKLGESTVEIAALHLCKELGLHDYLIENHPPKYGLNFHWVKEPGQSSEMNDYYSIWTNRNPTIAAFQIHRGKLERDLLHMNAQMGVEILRGKVADFDLTPGDEAHRVTVQMNDGTTRQLHGRHLVDAGGRKFLIGKKTDNVVRGPENHFGLTNGASWVRVKGVDRTRFHSGYDPMNAVASHYYGTNHFMGVGHWIWMIPIDMDTDEISIGVMHHHQKIPANTINTQEKLYAFFKSNHRILYDLLMTGELVDYHYFGRPGHSCKQLFSKDNWYVIGDAAYIFDAFYSLGTSGIAFEVESVTEIIRAKLAGAADAEQKREAYDAFNRFFMKNMVHTYRDHATQLGHAGVMSSRIFYEYMLWYGCLVPLYIGKWHLDPGFIKLLLKWNPIPFTAGVYNDFHDIVETGRTLPFMDCHRGDQLNKGYTTWRAYDDYLENAKYEARDVNIYRSVAKCYRTAVGFYARVRWRAYGWRALAPAPVARAVGLWGISLAMSAMGWWHGRRLRMKPKNRSIAERNMEFMDYRYSDALTPWAVTKEVSEPAMAAPGVFSSLAPYASEQPAPPMASVGAMRSERAEHIGPASGPVM